MLFQTGGECGQMLSLAVYEINRPALLEKDLVGLCVNGNGRSWFDTVVVKQCPFIWLEKEWRISQI